MSVRLYSKTSQEQSAARHSQYPPIVLVTGASGAIGSSTVRTLMEHGFRVLGIDRKQAALPSSGTHYRHLQVELEDECTLQHAIGEQQSWGELQHVISLAGGALPGEPPTKHDPLLISSDLFRASISANLTTHFLLLRAVLPWLRREKGDRSITFTSSFNALAGWGMPAYSAAKAGLIGMMHALTPPLGLEGIRVNVVAPGTVNTARTERIWSHEEHHFSDLMRTSALMRLGTPDDVARTFLAVCTILTHVTGQVLVVDGGQMVKRCT